MRRSILTLLLTVLVTVFLLVGTVWAGTGVKLFSGFDGLPIRGSAPNIGAYESWPKIF